MGKIHRIKSDEEKLKVLTKKIFKAQIILDRLKGAVKTGQKNINVLRKEREDIKNSHKA